MFFDIVEYSLLAAIAVAVVIVLIHATTGV